MDKDERRDRYRSDPTYRKNEKANAKAYRDRNKKRLKEIREDKKIWKLLNVRGKNTQCCDITVLASALGRSLAQIRRWESDRNIPATFRFKRIRYYTRNHYNMILRAWESKTDLESFFTEVTIRWEKNF